MRRQVLFLVVLSVLIGTGAVYGFNPNKDTSLVGWWKLDETSGTTAVDSSGKGNNGTLMNGPVWAAGHSNGALQFDGTDDYVDCGNGASLNLTSQVTVAAWVYNSAPTTAQQAAVWKGNNAYGLKQTWTGGQVSFFVYDTTWHEIGATPLLTAGDANTWIHWAGTYDGTAVKIYRNGVQAGTLSFSGTIATTTTGVSLGRGSGSQVFFTGRLDDVRIYNRGLSDVEIAAVVNVINTPEGFATNENPKDKNPDVPREAVLSWTPGPWVGTHDVYFGTSFDDVNKAGTSSSLRVGKNLDVDVNTYDPPGSLPSSTTYYWRVDEINATADHTVFTGNVWQFTTEPPVYIVGTTLGTAVSGAITAKASSTAVGWSAQNTVNKVGIDVNDMHNTLPTSMWLNNPALETGIPYPYIQYTFDRVYYLDSMWVWNYNAEGEDLNGNGMRGALVEYSTSTDPNNIVWTTLNTFTLNPAFGYGSILPTDKLPLGGVGAKYVRITAQSNQGGDLSIGVGLSEVRFYYRLDWAREPLPADKATGLDPTKVVLGWRPGRDAISNNVNLGTDPNALTKVNSLPSASYSPTGLNFGTKYYWRIDEVNGTTTWPGILWSFTTQEYSYPPIDDMESYTNDVASGKAIFQTWADGYTNPAINGSQVGYGTGTSYVETTIVHSPKQSMPFFYTNTTAAISEATRTFTTGQDWTVSGADTLSLWVQGVPTSYLGLNNGMILMNGSGADISGAADAFHFAYKQLSGDGTIIAKVESVDATDVWSKAGVMIRATLDAGSMEAANVVSGSSGISFQYRPTAAAATTAVTVTGLKAPYWVKLTRTGDVFKAQQSPDGITWTDTTATPSTTIVMGTNVLIGLAVTSHNANLVAGARFSNISINGTAVSAGDLTVVDVGMTTPTPAGNKLDRFYVALEDSAAHRVEYSPDPYAVVAGTWQQWKIPLSAFSSAGVNVHSVKKMTIGVGDKTKPASGATGQLYIDDIMFGHPAQ